MYSIHCSIHCAQYTVYTELNIHYQSSVYSIHSAQYTLYSAVYTVPSIQYTLQYTQCPVYSIHCSLKIAQGAITPKFLQQRVSRTCENISLFCVKLYIENRRVLLNCTCYLSYNNYLYHQLFFLLNHDTCNQSGSAHLVFVNIPDIMFPIELDHQPYIDSFLVLSMRRTLLFVTYVTGIRS